MSKGAATTMSSIIIIILLMGMLATYIVTVNDEIKKETEISLKKAEILRTKNTFYLLNRSLETTWFISTVQTIFKTCEDFSESMCQGNLEENLEEYMKEKMEDYTGIPNTIKVNDVDIGITGITLDIHVEDDRIISNVMEKITANYVETDIVSDTSHENTINTYFKKMAEYACSALDLVPEISETIATWPYCPEQCSCCPGGCLGKGVLLARAENHIINTFNNAFSSLEGDITLDLTKNSLYISGSILHYDFTAEFSEPARYYYHNEIANVFEKKPFIIRVKIEDDVQLNTCPCLPPEEC